MSRMYSRRAAGWVRSAPALALTGALLVLSGCQENGTAARQDSADPAMDTTDDGLPEEWLRAEGELPDGAPAREDSDRWLRMTHRAMATEFEIVAFPRTPDENPLALQPVLEQAFEAIDDVENRFSTWRATSQATYVNNHAADRPVPVSAEFFDQVAYGKTVWEATDGAFDLTVGPLMSLWGRYGGRDEEPSGEEVRQTLARVGMDKVRLDAEERTIVFDVEGVTLDFGGLAKGYAIDRAAEVLRRFGVETALVHGGMSSIVAMGAPPGTEGWGVGIRHPFEPDGTLDHVELRDVSASFSGCFLNLMEAGDEEVCDIMDPRTGYPVNHRLIAMARGATAAETDALSTAFMVMSAEEVRAYCAAHPEVQALVVPAPDDDEEPRVERIGF